jgi:ribosomal protein S18 acetylase RimI-like enzyme
MPLYNGFHRSDDACELPVLGKVPLVIEYRTFRNPDPPGIATIWNEAFTGRGEVHLRHSTPLETYVFAKPYFDPAGLIVAEDGKVPVGFAHAGFGPDTAGRAVSTATGVICILGVRPGYRRRGIGSELLRRSESYCRGKGAQAMVAGPCAPFDPFYFALYGGSNLPGFLASDAEAEPFLRRNGYVPRTQNIVLQRVLGVPLGLADGRFPNLRRQYDVRIVPVGGKLSWWQECVAGPVELVDFRLEERGTGNHVGRVCLWEMDHFAARWNQSSVGIVHVEIRPELRRKGLGKYLLFQTLRYLQDQFFALVEAQIPSSRAEAIALFQGLGFVQVDVGQSYAQQPGELQKGTVN